MSAPRLGPAPLVSVLMPMRNAGPHVGAALASILGEKGVELEVIVVDDASTDDSRARVAAAADGRVVVLDGPGRGISACLNAGLAEARGAVLMRCDADDLFPPGRMRRQVDWLSRHPDHIASCGAFATIGADGELLADLPCGAVECEITEELAAGIVRTHLGTYAIRVAAMKIAGGFREYFESAEDIDLQLRLAAVGRIGYVPETLYFYRIHSSSITHRQSSTLRLFFERLAHELHRQRLSTGADDLQRGQPPAKPAASTPPQSAAAHSQAVLLGRAWREHARGEKSAAIRTGVRALRLRPRELEAWRSVVALILKPAARSG